MSEFAKRLVVERRRRLVGSLMDYSEKNVFPHLSRDAQKAFRDKVMQVVGEYHDCVLDIIKSSVSDGIEFNDEALKMLGAMQGDMQRLITEWDAEAAGA